MNTLINIIPKQGILLFQCYQNFKAVCSNINESSFSISKISGKIITSFFKIFLIDGFCLLLAETNLVSKKLNTLHLIAISPLIVELE